MDKKKIITIVSIVTTVIIVAMATIIILHKNNTTTKAVIAEQDMAEPKIENPTEDPTIEPTEEVEPTESPKTSPKPSVPTGKYYIKVNNRMNTITIYTKDSNGNYTIPVKAMVCSTGYASPKNSKYQIKGRWTWGKMFGGVYTQWETLITDNILFHSVPYLKQYDPSTLEYWEYNKLGTTCSAGCIRLTCADALWIYNNCANGTWVEFYSDSNPGPLGKPSAPKIPTDSAFRGWDPTDTYNKGNPWLNAIIDTPSPEPSTEPSEIPIPVITPSVEPTITPVETPTPSIKLTPKITPIPSIKPSTAPTPITNVPTIVST